MSAVTAPFEALAVRVLRGGAIQTRLKEWKEYRYWKKKQAEEVELRNAHYIWFYTECFELTAKDYAGHRLLDVGCGPRGSLEWATAARESVGLDPLADRYRGLRTRDQRMTTVNAYAEAMPFTNAYFDDAFCFNALDHTADFRKALSEIARVLKAGGRFLLITEVNHEPTLAEPNCILPDELTKLIECKFDYVSRKLYRMRPDHDVYQSVRDGEVVETDMLTPNVPAIFAARCVKR